MSRGLIIAGVILLVLVFVWFLRIGGRIYYTAEGIRVQVKIGWLYFTVYPSKPKKKPAKKKKSKKPKKPSTGEKPKKKPKKSAGERLREGVQTSMQVLDAESGGDTQLLSEGIPAILGLLGKALRGVRVDDLCLHYTLAGRQDAAGAAMRYGAVYATGGVIYPLLSKFLTIQKTDIGARVDFTAEKETVYVRATISVMIGGVILLAIRALKVWLQLQKEWEHFKEYQKAQKVTR